MNTPQTFFCEWLPERFSSLAALEPLMTDFRLIAGAKVDESSFLLRAAEGRLAVDIDGLLDDALFVLRTTQATFDALIAPAVAAAPDTKLAPVARLLALDSEAQKLLGGLPGGIELVVSGPELYSIALVPGRPEAASIVCTVRCDLAALEELRSGKAQPLELLMAGRLELDGDIQVAMALAGLLMTP